MNKPEPMTPEQIDALAEQTFVAYMDDENDDADIAFARAIESARDAQWEELLSKQEPYGWVSQHTVKGPYEWQFNKERVGVYPDNAISIEPVYAAPVMAEKQDVPETNFGNTEPVAWRWNERGHWFDWTTDWTHHDKAKSMGCPIEYAAPVDQQAEIEAVRKANIDCMNHYNEARAEIERLKSSNESYITLANTAYEIVEQRNAEIERLQSLVDLALAALTVGPDGKRLHPEAREDFLKKLGEQK